MKKLALIITLLLSSKLIPAQTFTVGSTCCNYNNANKTFSPQTSPPFVCSAQDTWKLDIDGDLLYDIAIGSVKIDMCSSGSAADNCLFITTGNKVESAVAGGTLTGTKIIQSQNYGSNFNSILNWDTLPQNKTFSIAGPSALYEPVIYEYWSRPLVAGPYFSGQQILPFYLVIRKVLPSNDTIYGWIRMDSNFPGKVIDYAYTCGTYTGTPSASTITTPPTAICKGDSLALSGTPLGGVFYGAGISGNYFKSKNLAAGIYTINYAIPNPAGCSTLPSLLTLTVLPTSTITSNITSSALPSCPGQAVTLTASGALTYTWSGGIISPTLQVNPAFTTVYTVVASGLNSCFVSTFTQSIVQPSLNVLAINPIVCPGGATPLSAGSASSYTWSTGANTQTCVVSPSVNTVYTVVATYSPGCVVTNTVLQSVAVPTLTLAGPTSTICAGKYITLLATGAITYSWSTGANGSQLKDLPLSTTNYSVVGFGIGGCSDTANILVTVSNSNLILNAISNQSIICPGDTAILSLSGSSTYIVDGSPFEYYTVNQQTVAIVPQVTTTYVVYGDSLINGCVSTGVFTQTVASCVAVEELNLVGNDFKIYPNPAASKLFVEKENELSSEIELNLMNVDGRQVKSLRLTNKKQEIDLSEISSGIYFVEIVMEKHVLKKKIIITR